MDDITLLRGDCFERMKEIADGSVDMILTDPPYGVTRCKWDKTVPFAPMWEAFERIIKPNGLSSRTDVLPSLRASHFPLPSSCPT